MKRMKLILHFRLAGILVGLSAIAGCNEANAPAEVGFLESRALASADALDTSSSGTSSLQCRAVKYEVSNSPQDLTRQTIYGELCWQGRLKTNSVQVLVHGATYNRYYWDFTKYNAARYSYVQNAVQQGYVTLNIDRIGSGLSSKPDGLLNTIDADAFRLHQVVQALRSGELTGERFAKVLLVGHSLGSVISIAEAVFYQDVDGLILTGFTHNLNPIAAAGILYFFYPSENDPKFGPKAPTNYYTTIPGTRGPLFYHPPTSDPAVVAADEELKDVLAVGQLEILTRISSPESLKISVPVFLIVGDQDLIFCGGMLDCTVANSVRNFEKSYFSSQACLRTEVIADTGHDLNLHTNAGTSFGKIFKWLNLFSTGFVCK